MPRPTRTRLVSIRLMALAACTVLLAACAAQVRVAAPVYVPPAAVVDVQAAPPPLPIYVQPPCPVVGWMWTPGYWGWGAGDYFWVPGTWVAPPRIGFLWTPGYWGFVRGAYFWHAGYWGPHVGFYGGVHYGFGYTGVGFFGGRWVGGVYAYNRAVTNVNVTVIHNTYNRTVINNVNVTRVSYNGGAGIAATPTAEERLAERDQHIQPTAMQQRQVNQARRNPALAAGANHGRPPIAATPRAGAFHAPGVSRARGAARPNPRANQRRNGRRPAAKRRGPQKHPNAKRQRRAKRDGQ